MPPFIPFRSLFESRPKQAACLFGLVLGVVMVMVGVPLAWLMNFVPDELRGKFAGAGLSNGPHAWLLFLAIVFFPSFETIVAQVLPVELLRRLRAHCLFCVVASALLFGLGHFLNGGLVHGVTSFVAGCLLAYGYTAARIHGFWAAFITTAVAHTFNNAFLLLVLVPLLPE
jgi:hypothetical protein